jgi:4-amino-4-deoxy-L-arabinose transferase-like glycosyltransferase
VTRPRPPAWLGRPWVQVVALALLCGLIFGWNLGSGGFIDTEGHRVVPGYEMLATGEWLVPHMFERPYVRKPPGMPWAVAVATWALGESVWSARLVSALAATAAVLVAWWFGRAWFGRWGGLAAGAAQALMPQLWPVARHAEIEALNQLGTQLTALALVHVMVVGGRRARSAVVLGAIGTAAMLFAKGPAGAAAVGAVLVAACLVQRSVRPVVCTRVALILLPGIGLFAWWALALRGWLAAYTGPLEPALQSPGSFMWTDPVWEIGVFPIAAWVSALPASLALLFPWGPDARTEGRRGTGRGFRRPYLIALTLGWAWVLAVGLWWALGIGNPRYAMPAAVLAPPVAGYVVWGLASGRFAGARPGIARALGLFRWWAWPVALAVGWGGYLFGVESSRRATSGGSAGQMVGSEVAAWTRAQAADGRRLEGPVRVYADGVIEARPEVLLGLRHGSAQADGPEVQIIWSPGIRMHTSPRFGDGLLLRDDELGREGLPDLQGSPWAADLVSDRVTFHKYLAHMWLLIPTE